jgi:hypothetical protein
MLVKSSVPEPALLRIPFNTDAPVPYTVNFEWYFQLAI